MTVLGVVFNNYSRQAMSADFFPLLEKLPPSQAGPLAPLLAKAHADPHSLFNILLSPEAVGAIPADLREIILPPLKNALADSLHIVFLVAAAVTAAGLFASLLLGDAKVAKTPRKDYVAEAGETLFAEAFAVGFSAAILAGLIPALRVRRVTVVDALRYAT
jgi:hypothetical protein